MNSEDFEKQLKKCTTLKDLGLLKSSIVVEIESTNTKNTKIEPNMKNYIINNYDIVINRIFVEPNELDLDKKLKGQVMMKRANSLERHLKTNMGSFFSTWNGLKVERLERFKKTVEEREELMRRLGNKEYKKQMAKMKEIEKNIEEMAW